MPEESRILTLPALALRGTSMFPGSTFNFEAERASSVAALNTAMISDRLIFLTAQVNPEKEVPEEADLYKIGTVCRLSQILKAPGGHKVRAIVTGLYRARLLRVTSEIPCLWANVQPVNDLPCKAEDPRIQAQIRRCVSLFNEYASQSGSLTPEQLVKLADNTDAAFVSDYIAQNCYFHGEDKQALLEERSIPARLRRLCELLNEELQILTLEQQLNETASERVMQSQKEYFLREQLRAIREELGEDKEEDEAENYRQAILALGLGEESEEKLLKELDRLLKQPFGSAEAAVIRTYLDTVLELPWTVLTEDSLDLAKARAILDEDHFGLEKVKERILEFLAVRRLAPDVKGGVICLVGPPGVGKTSIAMSIARAMGRKTARLSLGGVHDEAEIRGHRKTYVGAMPGRIMTGVSQSGSRNPVLVLDEIDKLGSDYRGDPSAALLEALDGEQNHAFRDHFIELPFDLSQVLFITTANTTDTIPRPLLDRMEVIELGSYTDEEKLQIAKRHLLPKQRKKHGLNGNQFRLSDEVIRALIAGYTRESGVRQLEREIAALCRKAASAVAGQEARSLRPAVSQLETLLGPVKYHKDELTEPAAGLVHGLAWTSAGGEMLDVECLALPGSGKIELTGNLGDVMKESCRTAVSYIRSIASHYSVDTDFYKNTDIHLHFPEGAVPKDGPSAGAAICLCVLSALTGIAVRSDLAMTGELTLRGLVTPIGGLKEKTMAALRAGIREVLIPEGNLADLAEIDPAVRASLKITPVKTMEQVLAAALLPVSGGASFTRNVTSGGILPSEDTRYPVTLS